MQIDSHTQLAHPGSSKKERAIKFLLLLVYGLSSACLFIPGRAIIGNPLYLVGVSGMFLTMIGLWQVVKDSRSFYWIIPIAIVVRILMIFQFPESDDIYRYIWEGQIQLEGFNPYTTAPDAEELLPFRNEIWQDINHKSIPTIYWPFAELLFKFLAWLSPSIIFFKSIFTLFDLATVGLLFLLVKHFGIAKRHLLLFVLNPLNIVFVAGEGHLEPVMIFWVILCLYTLVKQRYRLMFLSLGIAVMTKFTPFFIIPLLINKKTARALPYLFLPLLLVIPYLCEGISFLSVPSLFTMEFRHNGLMYSLFHLFFDYHVAMYCSLTIAVILCGAVFLLTPNLIRATVIITGIFLLFTPTFHPWYLLIMTPFLVLYRSSPWILLHLTILPILFFFRPTLAETSPWRNRTLLMLVEYIPFVICGLYILIKNIRHWPIKYKRPESLSIIIPVLNEEDKLANCVQAIVNQNYPTEIIVVDGGSTDKTVERAQSFSQTTVIQAPPGRGIQIRAGIAKASGDIIMIVHADSLLRSQSINRVMTAMQHQLDAAGGSLSAEYEQPSLPYRFNEFLNNARTLLTGISFGDQAQFFRKEVIGDQFPNYRLMEDIELSFLIKDKGALLFFSKGVISSTRGWKKRGYFKNFFQVIFLSGLYVFMRKFSLVKDRGEWFYQAYYGKRV